MGKLFIEYVLPASASLALVWWALKWWYLKHFQPRIATYKKLRDAGKIYDTQINEANKDETK